MGEVTAAIEIAANGSAAQATDEDGEPFIYFSPFEFGSVLYPPPVDLPFELSPMLTIDPPQLALSCLWVTICDLTVRRHICISVSYLKRRLLSGDFPLADLFSPRSKKQQCHKFFLCSFDSLFCRFHKIGLWWVSALWVVFYAGFVPDLGVLQSAVWIRLKERDRPDFSVKARL